MFIIDVKVDSTDVYMLTVMMEGESILVGMHDLIFESIFFDVL